MKHRPSCAATPRATTDGCNPLPWLLKVAHMLATCCTRVPAPFSSRLHAGAAMVYAAYCCLCTSCSVPKGWQPDQEQEAAVQEVKKKVNQLHAITPDQQHHCHFLCSLWTCRKGSFAAFSPVCCSVDGPWDIHRVPPLLQPCVQRQTGSVSAW